MIKRRTIWIASGIAVLLCLLLFVSMKRMRKEESSPQQYFTRPASRQTPETEAEPKAEEQTAATGKADAAEETEVYISPVDFEALHAVNEDIYAWLDIPDTQISYPILRHPEDDAYYLRRSMDGQSDRDGVIFTEASYNGRDFSDPVTVAYGHNRYNGQMLSTLQREYSSAELLAAHEQIVVYLPDRELHYTVFAAVPFDDRHILYNYDFTNQRTFRLFFNEILSVRTLDAVFAEDASVLADDRVLILSTCLSANQNERFLVCGKLSETIPIITTD